MPRAARIPDVPHYLFDLEAPPKWTGPVVRLADLSDAERVRLGGRARGDQPPSLIRTWRCRNRYCGHWTAPHAFAPDCCHLCLTPRST